MARVKANPLLPGCIAQQAVGGLQGTFLPLIWFGLGFLPHIYFYLSSSAISSYNEFYNLILV